jgi:hypothetical protein
MKSRALLRRTFQKGFDDLAQARRPNGTTETYKVLIILDDLIGNLDMLRIECQGAGIGGRYQPAVC